jgi:hypothetical protein
VGLQALSAHFPAGSAELAAAEAALMDILASVVTGLKGVYGDEVLYQVSEPGHRGLHRASACGASSLCSCSLARARLASLLLGQKCSHRGT